MKILRFFKSIIFFLGCSLIIQFYIGDFAKRNMVDRIVLSVPLLYSLVQGSMALEFAFFAFFKKASYPVAAEKKSVKRLYSFHINALLLFKKNKYLSAREYSFFKDQTKENRKIYRSVFDGRHYVINRALCIIYFFKSFVGLFILYLTHVILLLFHNFSLV